MSPRTGRRGRAPAPAFLVVAVACLSATAATVAAAAGVLLSPPGAGRPPAPPVTGDPRADALLARMSLTDKLRLLAWVPGLTAGPGRAATLPGLPRLGIPSLHLADGAPWVASRRGAPVPPAPLTVAATFSQRDAAAVGAVIGREARALGDQVVTLPLGDAGAAPGRAAASFGDEPLLAGRTAAAEVAGIQRQGTMALAEGYPGTPAAAAADPARLHQVYLEPFRYAIQAGLAGIMCAPPAGPGGGRTGATAATAAATPGAAGCGDPGLLLGVLRDELGFGGFVTSGWGADPTALSLNSGLDMAMRGGGSFGPAALRAAIAAGSLRAATIDRAAGTVLAEMDRFGLLGRGLPGAPARRGSPRTPGGAPGAGRIAQQTAQDAATLLKDSGHALPLTPRDLSSLALIGPAAGHDIPGVPAVPPSPCRALRRDLAGQPGVHLSAEPGTSRAAAVAAARRARAAVVFAWSGTAGASPLPGHQNGLIRRVAAANPDTIVVLYTPGPVALPWLRAVKAVVEMWYPGGAAGAATASVLLGRADPAGRLPLRWPARAGGRGRPAGVFPFGYGLSYTSFRYSRLRVTVTGGGGGLTVRFRVTNTGRVAGEEVPQVYLGPPAHPPAGATFGRRTLAGYTRISLRPGQAAAVTVRVLARQLRYWNDARGWAAAAGPRPLYVGPSERVAALATVVTVPG